MKNCNKTNFPSKISLPKGVIALDNGKPVQSVEIPLKASELDLIRNALIKRHEAVFNRMLSLKRADSRVKAQLEDNILISTLKRMGSIKSEKRFPLKAFDNEWEEILYCLEHSKSKSKATKELIEFLTDCLGD